MDKRRKSTKEVDDDGDDDGVSLSIMKMAGQGGEHVHVRTKGGDRRAVRGVRLKC